MAEGGTNDSTQNAPSTNSSPVQFLETPEGRKLAYVKVAGSSPGVVFVHGLNSNMSGQKALALEDCCQQRGCSYVRFDLSGHGQSSEDFKTCNLSMWLEDLDSVISSLTEGPQVIVGSSIGGWLMFLYAMRYPDKVSGLVGIACAPDFTQAIWRGLDKDAQKEVKRTGVYMVPSSYSEEPYELTIQFFQDGDKHSILDMPGIELIKVPTMLFHGEKDDVIPPSTSLKLMQSLQCPVSLKTIEDGDHRLSRPQDIKLVLQALTDILSPNEDKLNTSELDD